MYLKIHPTNSYVSSFSRPILTFFSQSTALNYVSPLSRLLEPINHVVNQTNIIKNSNNIE